MPVGGKLAGWAALVRAFNIQAPVRRPGCVSAQHVRGSHREDGGWTVFDKRYWPGDNFADHLAFALRHEHVDLLLFKRLCDRAPSEAFAEMVRAAPLGNASRRAWYLYEFLTGRTLDIDDSPAAAAIDVLDTDRYFTGSPRLSRRHRVRDNLLGTGRFCPVIRRTLALTEFADLDLASKARETVGRTGAHLFSRAASFMLRADSRASFEIEGERPPRNRLERWGRAVLEAGRRPLTLDEILRLQRILIEDTRFVDPGLRQDGVFLGGRDHNGDPLPEFVGARPEDLRDLMNGLLAANDRMREDGLDAVLKAAATAFGFVYVHPFQDGNGRMHRCLIHHVLAERIFTAAGHGFPGFLRHAGPDRRLPGGPPVTHRAAHALHRLAANTRAERRGSERHRRHVSVLRRARRRRSSCTPASSERSSKICRARSTIWPAMTKRCAGLWKPSNCRTASRKI